MIQKNKYAMLDISYNMSPKLKNYLSDVEDFRKKILFASITQKTKLMLRWQANLNRISAAFILSGSSLKKQEIIRSLSESLGKKSKIEKRDITNYKMALDNIFLNWLGSPNPVTSADVIDLYKMIGKGRLSVPPEELGYLLDYLQARQENPIIIAALVQIELNKMQAFTEDNFIVSTLISLLFLYKYGYDFRGLIAYETEWIEDESYFRQNYQLAMKTPSLTLWLEYFSGCILHQLEKVYNNISKPTQTIKELSPSFWELNDRQKSILSYLDQPEVSITNRKIQKKYKISQVTSSRDLAKLTTLGFLFSHGKGRSVYYTKI